MFSPLSVPLAVARPAFRSGLRTGHICPFLRSHALPVLLRVSTLELLLKGLGHLTSLALVRPLAPHLLGFPATETTWHLSPLLGRFPLSLAGLRLGLLRGLHLHELANDSISFHFLGHRITLKHCEREMCIGPWKCASEGLIRPIGI